jgi:hypothetical protein
MLGNDFRPPWDATLTQGEHTLILYFLALAGLGFIVGCLRGWLAAGEIGTRYRSAVIARLGVNSVAALTYLFLVLEFQSAYAFRHYFPTSSSINTFSIRYVECGRSACRYWSWSSWPSAPSPVLPHGG